jgi:hypothetical protein
MSRALLIAAMVAAVLLQPRDARAVQTTTAEYAGYDVVGTLGVPLVTAGMFQLGHLIDLRLTPPGGDTNTSVDKVFALLSLGIDYVGLKYLGDGLHVPTTWSATAAGMGVGLGAGLLLLGIDAGIISLAHLNANSVGAGVLSLLTIVGFSLTTSLMISTDPFHLAHPASHPTTNTMSASLVSFTF